MLCITNAFSSQAICYQISIAVQHEVLHKIDYSCDLYMIIIKENGNLIYGVEKQIYASCFCIKCYL